MYPLHTKSKLKTTVLAIILIWVTSFCIGLPGLIVAEVIPKDIRRSYQFDGDDNDNISLTNLIVIPKDELISKVCILGWSEEWSKAYDYTLFILMYILPLIILACTYVPICIHLWFHKGLGEVTRAQAQSVRSKRRAVKMLCALMIIFAFCWLPYQLFFVLIQVYPSLRKNYNIPIVFICCYWLAMSNSMYNPIIYILMNRKFRKGFYRIFSCLSNCRSENKEKSQQKRLNQQLQPPLQHQHQPSLSNFSK